MNGRKFFTSLALVCILISLVVGGLFLGQVTGGGFKDASPVEVQEVVYTSMGYQPHSPTEIKTTHSPRYGSTANNEVIGVDIWGRPDACRTYPLAGNFGGANGVDGVPYDLEGNLCHHEEAALIIRDRDEGGVSTIINVPTDDPIIEEPNTEEPDNGDDGDDDTPEPERTCRNRNSGKDGTPDECNAGGGQERHNR